MKSFMLNTVLQRLIVRQVWKFPKLWDGFIRCVQKTVPDSYAILLQLPSEQLLRFVFKLISMSRQKSGKSKRLLEMLLKFPSLQQFDNVVKRGRKIYLHLMIL